MRQPHGSLEYYLTTEIHLSLEMFHNEGLTPEETRAVIEKQTDIDGHHFFCTPGGVNRNWTISTRTRDTRMIESIVIDLELALRSALREKFKEKPNADDSTKSGID
jgi:hypothetical protein